MPVSLTTTPAGVAGPANEGWKAQAFINLWLPKTNADGTAGKTKVGAIPLKMVRNFDARLIARLSEGGPEALAAMQSMLIIDFQLVNKPDSEQPALPF